MSCSKDIHKQRQKVAENATGQLSGDNRDLARDPNHPSSEPSTYVPVQFSQEDEDDGQDPTVFYGSLIDQAGYPSEVLCRMSDGLFFYVDHNCPQSRGTQLIEPEKIFWENVALGHDADVINGAGAPVLDRRGYIRFRLFEIRANPEECHQVGLAYELENPRELPFPTPIPRLAFPAYPDYERRNIFINWQTKAVSDLMRKRALKAEADRDSGAPSSPSDSGRKPTEKRSKFSRLIGWGGKDDKDKGKDKKEEPEAVRQAAHEKKQAAMISVGASVVSTLIGQFA